MLDRRETDPGPKEENRHPERVKADLLQVEERSVFPFCGIRWDGGGHGEESEARFEMLPPALASVLRAGEDDRRGKCADDGGRRPLLALFHDRRERDERWRRIRRCPLSAERHLIKGALAEPAKPAMKRRVVRSVLATSFGHGRSQALPTGEIRAAMALDLSEREFLVGNRIAGKRAPAASACIADDERNHDHQTLSVLGNEGASNEGGRDAEDLGVAAFALKAEQTRLDQLPLQVVDCVSKLDMVYQ